MSWFEIVCYVGTGIGGMLAGAGLTRILTRGEGGN